MFVSAFPPRCLKPHIILLFLPGVGVSSQRGGKAGNREGVGGRGEPRPGPSLPRNDTPAEAPFSKYRCQEADL